MKLMKPCLFLLSIIFPVQLWAVNYADVKAMQMPAWIQHSNGYTEALKPGMKIQSGDQLISGQNSRILVRLKEGSQIKLGENAQLNFNKLQISKIDKSLLEAAVDLVQGAFRFTTTVFGNNKKRNIQVNIGVISVGIRGTDIWGKSNSKEDLVALLEGSVDVQRAGEPVFNMSDALSYYLVPKNKHANAITMLSQEQLTQWALETEIFDGGGVLIKNGMWTVYLMSLDSLKATSPVIKQFAKAGYATDVEKFSSLGRDWYRIKITGFKSRVDAKMFAVSVDGLYGSRHPWVGKSN